jgi:hypothetical protein
MLSRKKVILLIVAVGLFMSAPQVFAQELNPNLSPNYGTITVGSGSTYNSTTILSGGSRTISRQLSGCRGYATQAPDIQVNIARDGFSAVTFTFDASGDTTMVVRAPGNRWYCDDDSGGGLNPRVYLTNPVSGNYQVWIGSYSSGSNHRGTFAASLSGSGRNVNRFGVVCIINETSTLINYEYRWGSESWTSSSVSANNRRWHSWEYTGNSQTSPSFQVRFDSDMTSGINRLTYTLDRNAMRTQSCDGARQYAFQFTRSNRNRIDLYSR